MNTGTAAVAPPVTYQQWLDCLSLLRGTLPSSSGVCEAMARGSFSGSPVALAALEKQIAESIQESLNRTSRRFIREVNSCLEFHDLLQLEYLFRRFRTEVLQLQFFRELAFLPEQYRTTLSDSIVREVSAYWDRLLRTLRQQTLEYSDPDLEDAVYRIGRIKPFPKQE